MQIELVCIGTELLEGKLNTDIGYVSGWLEKIGLKLSCCTTVSDNPDDMERHLKEIFNRADLIFTTGGLGPTFDDLTREVTSKILNKKLVLYMPALERISRHFQERNIEMPESNEKQAYIIDGAVCIDNNAGTAPGQFIETKHNNKNRIIILLPGPPNELNPMFESYVYPLLKKRFEQKISKSKTLHIFGMPESKVDELIRPVIDTERKLEKEYVSFTILAHKGIIDVKSTVSGANELIIDEILHNLKKEFYDILKDSIYGEDRDTPESVAGGLLMKKKLTLSLAESCTGGLVGDKITNIPGSSIYFKGGIVAYSNELKIKLLNVSQDTLSQFGAVSRETAQEMAVNIRQITGSDIGMSITGIAGPAGSTESKPLGLVYFGLATEKDSIVNKREFNPGLSRQEIKDFAANYILDMLRRKLCGYL